MESDNEDENEGTNSGGVEGDEEEEKEPAYVPPRKMQLLDISDIAPENQTKEEEPVYHVIKLPNLVGINTTAYDRETHDMEKEEEEYRGYVHNMIRWRYKTNDDTGEIVRDEHGHPVRESNTRVVKWSDGSYTLHVGKEVLEMDNLDSSVPLDNPDESMAGFPGNNGYLYVSQKAKIIPPTKKELEGPPKNDEEDMEDDEEEEKLDKRIMAYRKKNRLATVKEMAEALKVSPAKIRKRIAYLLEKNRFPISRDIDIATKEKPVEEEVVEVRYRYDWRPEYAGLSKADGYDKSRKFCQTMLDLSATKLYTRSDINDIGQLVGWNVWERRGGWFTLPNGNHRPSCRHMWVQQLVVKKGTTVKRVV